jgi:predicted site-specific integrase-resolvase
MNLTPEEAAARLRVSLATLAGWRFQRKGPAFRKFGRRVLYPLDLLEQWEADATNGGAAMNLNTKEASERLRIPEKTLANWRNKRIGPPFRKFGRRVLYPLDQLERWEAEQTIPTS